MTIEIREFSNIDVAEMARLWKEHHQIAGMELPLSATTLDHCVLSKPYFDSAGVLFALIGGKYVGYIHVGFSGSSDGSDVDYCHGILSALCVSPRSLASERFDSDQVAQSLIVAGHNYLQKHGAVSVTAIGISPHVPFYLGIAQGDGVMGVVAEDQRLQKWLFDAGYQPTRPTESWELNLGQYRQPMDRNQIQIRRQTHVDRILSEPELCWWHSCVLGHSEQIAFQLTARLEGRVEGQLLFWQHDSAATGFHSPTLRLWPMTIPVVAEQRERTLYLLAESLRQLQQERFTLVRTVAQPDQQGLVDMLQRLGFRSRASGVRFEKVFQ